jgi:outer membrane lipoprotein-sorting protein
MQLAYGSDLTGRDIIEKVINRETPETTEVRVRMVLVDKNGKEREREFFSYSKEYPEGRKSVMKFEKPADVKGMGFLQIQHKKGEDEQFLYMPELKRVRRLTGSARRGSFFGSDLSYEDLEERDVDEDNHKLIREEQYENQEVYVVESSPKNPESSQYSKVIQWIRKDNYIPVKVEFYKNEELIKELKVEKMDRIDGYWTVLKTVIKTLKTGHSTVVELKEIKNNKPIQDDVFTERFLTR